MQQYRYSLLPDARAYIRLLSLEPGGNDANREVDHAISVWPFDHAPCYHAVSYIWASSGNNESI